MHNQPPGAAEGFYTIQILAPFQAETMLLDPEEKKLFEHANNHYHNIHVSKIHIKTAFHEN